MLIKTQEKYNGAYCNIKDMQEMKVITERRMKRSNFDGILAYTIMINADSNVGFVASYQSRQDAEDELERFKNAWMNGDTEFEFAEDDELVKKIDDIKEQRAKELEQEIEKFEKLKQEREQKRREMLEEAKEQAEFDRALTKFFCYVAAFLTYGAVIHFGVKYIKAPLPLAVAGILAGVIGTALVSYAKKQ